MTREQFTDAFGVFAFAGVAAVLWFVFYVQPRDQFLHDVMDCMGDDVSEPAYQRCAEEIHASTVRKGHNPPSM